MRLSSAFLVRLLGTALVIATAAAARAGEPSPRTLEYPVKAAFLYQFTRFVEWPPAPSEPTFCIGVLGPDPFGAALDRAVEGKTVAGRPLAVRRARRLEGLEGCPILFVGSAEGHGLAAVLARTARWPALTVGESDEFARGGGMVRFFLDGNHVRFEINLPAAEEAGLRLSSRLLALARVTGTRGGER